MPQNRISELTAITSVQPADLLEISKYDGVSAYLSRKITVQDFANSVSIAHNGLTGKQGGTASEYYHLTSTDYIGQGTGVLIRATSPTISSPTINNPDVDGAVLTNPTTDDAMTFKEIPTPLPPAAGYHKIYYKSDGRPYELNNSSVEVLIATRPLVIDSGKNNLTTNSYINGPDGIPTNISPFVLPYDCTLTSMSVSTDGPETWTAEVHVNGTLKTGAILSVSASSSAIGSSYGAVASFGAGDKIMTYCNGSSINKPRIVLLFRRE